MFQRKKLVEQLLERERLEKIKVKKKTLKLLRESKGLGIDLYIEAQKILAERNEVPIDRDELENMQKILKKQRKEIKVLKRLINI